MELWYILNLSSLLMVSFCPFTTERNTAVIVAASQPALMSPPAPTNSILFVFEVILAGNKWTSHWINVIDIFTLLFPVEILNLNSL